MKKTFFMLFILCLSPQAAHAQLSADHGQAQGGAVILGQTSDACDSQQKQAIRWSSGSNTIEMCDGNGTWRKIVSASGNDMPPAPSEDTGYFVLSHNAYTGNLGDLAGANSICLNELTTYNWRGKADAQARNIINSNNVKAWICGRACQNLNAWQSYQFAVANDPDKGGATISVEDDSLTHNNTQNWSGHNYWGQASYYSGREPGTAVKFGVGSYSPCENWTYDGTTTSIYGAVGTTYTSDAKRWRNYAGGTCPGNYRIACMVHP